MAVLEVCYSQTAESIRQKLIDWFDQYSSIQLVIILRITADLLVSDTLSEIQAQADAMQAEVYVRKPSFEEPDGERTGQSPAQAKGNKETNI